MRQTAFVTEIHGDMAIVASERASSCGSCAGKASCHTLGSWKEAAQQGRVLSLNVKNAVGARLGDEVVIEVPDGLMLKTAFRLYGIPMLSFILVGGLVYPWGGDVASALFGMLSVFVYYAWIWWFGESKGVVATVVAVRSNEGSYVDASAEKS